MGHGYFVPMPAAIDFSPPDVSLSLPSDFESGPRGRVLVVDDDPRMLSAITTVVRRTGYEVITATDVDQALQATARHAFDAAIVDYNLHDENGLAVLWRLRKLQPGCARLLCTGRDDLAVFVDAVNHGEINKIVRKPFRAGVLLGHLDEAVRAQRERGRLSATESAEERLLERTAIEQILGGGLLEMATQPIVHRDNVTRPIYYEALVRPQHELLSNPVALFDAAERQGQVVEVSSLVLGRALGVLERLPADVGLFVNLHPEQLRDPATLVELLSTVGDQAHRVALEITERSRLRGIDRWDESVRLATEMGFGIAVDDLGAGYSSLSILADLRPQFIKLDMSLVRGIDSEPRKQRLVQLMATFGEATASEVIAEGVETAEEAAVLQDCGITLMQGYLFGRPARA